MQFIDKSQYTLHYRLIFLCYLTMTTNIPIEEKNTNVKILTLKLDAPFSGRQA